MSPATADKPSCPAAAILAGEPGRPPDYARPHTKREIGFVRRPGQARFTAAGRGVSAGKFAVGARRPRQARAHWGGVDRARAGEGER